MRFRPTFRAISSRYPTTGIYDRIAGTAEYPDALAVEALTNPRIRDEHGLYSRKVRAKDRIAGPGTQAIVASFMYSQAGRFCDGTYGVYYCALSEQTAIAESAFHTEAFLRRTNEPSIHVDKRIYTATIAGDFDDVRARSMRARIYDRNDYGPSQVHGRKIYDADVQDGIVYNSVRDRGGACVVAFRPAVVTDCTIHKYVQFRWDGQRITGIADLANLRPNP